MRPFMCTELVRIPACIPVRDTAGHPRSAKAMAISAMETCSPVDNSISISLLRVAPVTCLARVIKSSVVSPIADTVTTTWSSGPFSRSTRAATALIFSGVATELPPNFFTTIPMCNIPSLCLINIIFIRHKTTKTCHQSARTKKRPRKTGAFHSKLPLCFDGNSL